MTILESKPRFKLGSYEGQESYLHKGAKELLFEWLTEKWGGYEEPIKNEIMFIEQNTHEQWKETIGYNPQIIQLEYPITPCFPYYIDENHCTTIVNDECRNSTCRKCKVSCTGCSNVCLGTDSRPSEEGCYYRENLKHCYCLKCEHFNPKSLLAIADIAIGYEGIITTIFEVTHKNPVSPKKIDVYKYRLMSSSNYTRVLEIDARHILGQIGKPKRLFVRRLV